jgi:hypothetical protein
MSKIALSGNASGTGTLTIAAPNTNTDRTLTLPDNTGTIVTTGSTFAGTGPAFSAYLGTTQNPANATYTKVQIDTETFDTASCFDTATYRFTPNVAGYYQVQAACRISSTTPSTYVWAIYKNGSNVAELNIANAPAAFDNRVVSSLVSMNGTTDYLEFYCYCSALSGQAFNAGANSTYFQAFLARAA